MTRRRVVSTAIVVGVAVLLCMPHGDPNRVDLAATFLAPGPGHPLGTDNLGRDVWSRVVLGLSRTLTVMILATGLSALVGGLLGMIAGYLGGPTRALIMLATDLVLIVPTFVGALIFAALFGLTPVSAGIVLGLFGIGPYVNQACALTEAVRGRAFLQIETLLGTPTPVIVARHIAPAVMRPLAVYLGASAANAVLAYAGLAFIGLGVDTTLPDWGTMLYDYRVHLSDHPLLVLWPTLGIAILALSAHAVFDEAEGKTP